MTMTRATQGGSGSTTISPVQIGVADVLSACTVSAGIVRCYAEAASVMLDRYHEHSPVFGTVSLDGEERCAAFTWPPSTDDEKASHANELDAIQYGAYAVSFIAANRMTGYVVRKRAHHGSGADWLMTKPGERDDEFVRLEVSGVGRDKSLEGRLKDKVAQLGRGDLARPGLAVVVGFEGAAIVMRAVGR